MNNSFNLVASQDDPSDVQLSKLMSQVRQTAHNRVARVDSLLTEALARAIKAKHQPNAARAQRNA